MPEQDLAADQPPLRAVDVMRPAVAVGEDESVAAAWELMRRGGLEHLTVVRYGRAVGLLDDPPLLRALASGAAARVPHKVRDLVSNRWVAVRREAALRPVYEQLVRRGVAAAVVVDERGSPIGVVTREQALDALLGQPSV